MRLISRKKFYFLVTLMAFSWSCQNKDANIQNSPSISSNDEKPTDEIETDFSALFAELEGIEKYYVRDNLSRLHSLLKYKNDEQYLELEKELEKDEFASFLIVTELDVKNGFVAFHNPQLDCKTSMTYWKLDNDAPLIATATVCCTMFCEGEITFEKYEQEEYQIQPNETIILNYQELLDERAKIHEEGGVDYAFNLPQKGKNIEYCIGGNCRKLKWKNGSFE